MKLRGTVQRGVVAPGSHSERESVLLVSANRRYALRSPGAPTFGDRSLDALVGRTIVADGVVRNGVFLLTAWRDVTPRTGG